MPSDWSRLEVEATVADYFEMWSKELRGERFNKSAHNAALRSLLTDRSEGAVEFKHANISAVLIELGLPYVAGYKPRGNYQELLREVIIARLDANPGLETLARTSAQRPVDSTVAAADWSDLIVPAPTPAQPVKPYSVSETRVRMPKVNYLEMEARNGSLGLAGERFVLDLEERRLRSAGQKGLAGKIEHVAARSDGMGYDILSFEDDGRERLIEVKTTRYGEMTPFFATRKEVAVSEERCHEYHIFRVFKFEENPKAFVLSGSIRESVALEPITYQASFRTLA